MYPYLFEGWIGDYALMPSYAIALALAFTLAYLETIRQTLRHKESPKHLEGLFAVTLLCTAVGSRLFHVLFEEPRYYLAHPLEILALWQGGFTLYGGLLVGTVGAWLFCRAKKVPPLQALDRMAPGVLLGIAIGRLGCFAAGCCWGTPTSLPWGVTYEHRHALTPLRGMALHPVQLYEAFWAGLLFWVLLRWAKTAPRQGSVFYVGLGGYALGRFIFEFFRGDESRGVVPGVGVSSAQIISLLVVAALMLVLKRQARLGDLFSSLQRALRPRTNG